MQPGVKPIGASSNTIFWTTRDRSTRLRTHRAKLVTSKEEQINNLVQALSTDRAQKLAVALEAEKIKGSDGNLPIDAILMGLRPRLREGDPETRMRLPTPQRLFCCAFESLIVDDGGRRKRPARIDRSSLTPIWQWLMAADGGNLREDSLPLADAILAGDEARWLDALAHFDRRVTEAVKITFERVDNDGKFAKRLTTRLGGDRAKDDLKEIGAILEVGADIRALQRDLPVVMSPVTQSHRETIGHYLQIVEPKGGKASAFLVLSIMHRLPKPWNVVGLSGQLLEAEDDHDLKQSSLSLVGERVIEDIEIDAESLSNLRSGEFDPTAALELLRSFAARQKGMTKELGMRKDGDWGKRLLKARGTVSSGLERLFDKSVKEFSSTLSTRKPRSGSKASSLRVPDLARAPDAEKGHRLASLAKFIVGSWDFASQLGYGVAYEKARSEIDNYIDEFAGLLVDARTSAATEDEGAIEAYAVVCEAAMRPLFSDEACQVFARRMASAKKQASRAAS